MIWYALAELCDRRNLKRIYFTITISTYSCFASELKKKRLLASTENLMNFSSDVNGILEYCY